MKRIRAVLAAFIAVTLLFLSACGKEPTPDTPTPDTSSPSEDVSLSLQLLYCSNDTLNPYATKNKSNSELGLLLFDSLVTVSDNFEPIYLLAESVNTENNICSVKLRSARFSDGSAVTAEDVVSSCTLAKESALYKPLFYEVKSVTAVDGLTVTFELTRHDPYFANMLTFPIIKKGSESMKNEDNVEIPPIGSGRFVFSAKEKALVANEYYYGECNIKRISLVDAPDSESVEHYVEIGATDFYYTDPIADRIIRMSGKKTVLNMNRLFYIGINHSYGKLSSPELRQAISSAIDRKAIAKTSFYGYAKAANGFFHPEWEATSGYQTLQTTADKKISVENLEKIGYNSLDNEGFRVNSHGTVLGFTLLVNGSNPVRVAAANLIKEQLAEVGIKITLNKVSSSQYHSALANGHFQLYLGEVEMPSNMDVSELVIAGGKAAYGINAAAPADKSEKENDENTEETFDYASVVKGYQNGKNSITEVATSLINYMPVVPVAFRDAILFYSDNISDIGEVSSQDIFLSLNKYN